MSFEKDLMAQEKRLLAKLAVIDTEKKSCYLEERSNEWRSIN